MVEQEGVQRQAVRVDDGRHQVLRVMEEGQRAHVPAQKQTATLARGTAASSPFPRLHLPAKVGPGGLGEADDQAAAKGHSQEAGSDGYLQHSHSPR